MKNSKISLLAVYGTLRRGGYNNDLLQNAEYVDTIAVNGIACYDFGYFPVAIRTGEANDVTIVDIFAIKAGDVDTWERLDTLEGVNKENPELSMYNRQTIDIQSIGETSIYLWNGKVDGLPYITDWITQKGGMGLLSFERE